MIGCKGGKIGGKSTSEAKKQAAQENGKLGGRPKKTSKQVRDLAKALIAFAEAKRTKKTS